MSESGGRCLACLVPEHSELILSAVPRAEKHWVTMATGQGGCAGPRSPTPSALVVRARTTVMLVGTECCVDRKMRYPKLGEVPEPQFPYFIYYY